MAVQNDGGPLGQVTHAARDNRPLLIIHSEADNSVPIANALKMV
jgi:dipeptidyl aminopeptidase/acylaminoacyl peptidase